MKTVAIELYCAEDLLDGELRTCDGCGKVEDAGGPDQDGSGRSACCSDVTRCVVCSAEVSWRDCDIHTEGECYATDCDTPFGCGRVARDCEDWEVVAA